MDLRIIYLPAGGLAETHGNVVRLTTPSAGALAAHRLTRRELQEATVGEGGGAGGRKMVPGAGGRVGGGRQARPGAVVAAHRGREDHGHTAGTGSRALTAGRPTDTRRPS